MVTNFICRFSFLAFAVTAYSVKIEDDFDVWKALAIAMGISMILEAYRRTQWAILRVENESIHNFEGYRVFLEIPPVIGQDEDAAVQRLRRIID